MEFRRSVDRYCERTDPGFWSEPLNAASNGLNAVVLWLAATGVGRGEAGYRVSGGRRAAVRVSAAW